MAITLFGSASNPADNGTGITAPVVITPPGSMQAGDLVFVTVCFSGTSGTLTVSQAGGQSWTSLTTRNQTRNRTRSFWCIFNGSWSASPSWTGSGTSNVIARMLVFRPNGGTISTWGVDVAEVSAVYAAASPVIISSITTTRNGALVIVGWTSADDNTWGSLSGSTHSFTALSPAQVRNTSTTYQQSQTHAWMIDATAGATGTVQQSQATLGNDAGTTIIMAFYEIEQKSSSSAVSGNGSVAGAVQKGGLKSILNSGKGTLVALGLAGMLSVAGISGGGSQVAIGQKAAIVSATIAGGGSLVAIGEKAQGEQYSGAATISGGGSQIALGNKSSPATSAISSGGAILSEGRKNSSDSSVISGTGLTSASGQREAFGIVPISGKGAVIIIGGKQALGDPDVSGGGSIVAIGNQSGQEYSGVAVVSGGGSLSATGVKIEKLVINLQSAFLASAIMQSGFLSLIPKVSGYENEIELQSSFSEEE